MNKYSNVTQGFNLERLKNIIRNQLFIRLTGDKLVRHREETEFLFSTNIMNASATHNMTNKYFVYYNKTRISKHKHLLFVHRSVVGWYTLQV